MPLKLITQGSEYKSINGNSLVENKYKVSIYSIKKKKNQVESFIETKGSKFKTNDSLQNFLDNIVKNNNSLFNYLSQEKFRVKNKYPLSFTEKIKRHKRKIFPVKDKSIPKEKTDKNYTRIGPKKMKALLGNIASLTKKNKRKRFTLKSQKSKSKK